MNKILVSKKFNVRSFEVVAMNELPARYFVWNIGRQNFEFPCYVPFAEELKGMPFHVDQDTLKAVELPDETISLQILNEAGRRHLTKADVVRMIEEYGRNSANE